MSSISLPAALWLIAGAASAVWLAAGWRWLARLLHILQGGGYYQRDFVRWLLQAGRRHQIIFTSALLLLLLTVGLQAAPWPAWLPLLGSCRLGPRGLCSGCCGSERPPAKQPLRWTTKALALATLVSLQALLAGRDRSRSSAFRWAARAVGQPWPKPHNPMSLWWCGFGQASGLSLGLVPAWPCSRRCCRWRCSSCGRGRR